MKCVIYNEFPIPEKEEGKGRQGEMRLSCIDLCYNTALW